MIITAEKENHHTIL